MRDARQSLFALLFLACSTPPGATDPDPVGTIRSTCDALASSSFACDGTCRGAREDARRTCADVGEPLVTTLASEYGSFDDCTGACASGLFCGSGTSVMPECRCEALCASERSPEFQQALAAFVRCLEDDYRLACF